MHTALLINIPSDDDVDGDGNDNDDDINDDDDNACQPRLCK